MKHKGVLCAVLMFLAIAGCDSNVFKSFESKGGSSTNDAQLALDQGDFAAALAAVAALVPSDPSACGTGSAEVKQACSIKAQATLGSAGFNATDIIEKAVNTFTSTSSSTTNVAAIEALISGINRTSLDTAADLFNGLGVSSTPSDSLVTAGVANAIQGVLTVYDAYDTDKNGKLETADFTGKTDAQVATTWNTISATVVSNATNAVNFSAAAFSGQSGGTNTATTDIQQALNDAKTQINTLNSTPTIANLTNFDG